jgi:hypothetical protein
VLGWVGDGVGVDGEIRKDGVEGMHVRMFCWALLGMGAP